MKKRIITVVGKDSVGITAKVCVYLANNQINILDISQTIVAGYFNMMMVVDTQKSSKSTELIASELGQIGEVAHHVQLGALGQARRTLAQQGFGQHLRGAGRVVVHRQGQTGSAAAFYGFGKDGFHSRPPSFSTMASTCARVLHSVQASKSTSSMPA